MDECSTGCILWNYNGLHRCTVWRKILLPIKIPNGFEKATRFVECFVGGFQLDWLSPGGAIASCLHSTERPSLYVFWYLRNLAKNYRQLHPNWDVANRQCGRLLDPSLGALKSAGIGRLILHCCKEKAHSLHALVLYE